MGLHSSRKKVPFAITASLGIEHLVRIDYHGSKEVPTGTCHAILRAAGLRHREE